MAQLIVSPKSKSCQLPADTTQESQLFGFEIPSLSGFNMALRVRQYESMNTDEFYDLMEWTEISTAVS